MDHQPTFADHWKRGVFILFIISLVLGFSTLFCAVAVGAAIFGLDVLRNALGESSVSHAWWMLGTGTLAVALVPYILSQYANNEAFIPKLPWKD